MRHASALRRMIAVLLYAITPVIAPSVMPTTLAAPGQQPVCRVAAAQQSSAVYALADHARIYRNTGQSATWQSVSSGLPVGSQISTLALASVNSNVFYAGMAGQGIFKTFNGGTYWFDANDETTATTYVYAMAVDPTDNARIYAGGDNAVYRSLDGGVTWEQGNIGVASFTVLSIALDPMHSEIVYVGTDGEGIFRSNSQMTDWVSVSNGLPEGTSVHSLVIESMQAGTLYAGTDDGVFVSHDGGSHWIRQSVGLPNGQAVGTLAISDGQSIYMYAGTSQGLYMSSDNAAHWRAVAQPLGRLPISVIVTDPANVSRVYVASGGVIWRSDDVGKTWVNVAPGLDATNVSYLAVFHPTFTPTSACLPPAGRGDWQYFPQVGHTVSGAFRAYFLAHGGVAVFGYPRTEQIAESGHIIQYFDNLVLTQSGGFVTVQDVGLLLRRPYPAAPVLTGTPQHPLLRLGDHNVSDIFLRFWRSHGGETILGMPFSEELYERNDDGTGRYFSVQWFTNARLEYHPELSGSAVVQLGKLGDDILRERGWL